MEFLDPVLDPVKETPGIPNEPQVCISFSTPNGGGGTLRPRSAASQERTMRNVYEVLREKESAVRRVAREIEILRLAAPLLTGDAPADSAPTENLPPAEVVAEDANTGIVSASPLPDEPDSAGTDVPDEANSLPMKKISARLKRLARPLANARRFVAG
jgi:hypothetical protein